MRHFKCQSLITLLHHPYVIVSWLVSWDLASGTLLSGERQQVAFFFSLDEGGDTVKSVACQIQCVGTLVVVCISLGVCTSPLLESGTNISET